MTTRPITRRTGALFLALALALGGSIVLAATRPAQDGRAACAGHALLSCPFCEPERVAALGECREHAVPEALCSRCRPALEAAFRAEGDWCAGHGLPESQCVACHPELAGAADGSGADAKGAAVDGPAEAPPAPDVTVATEALPRARRPPSASCTTERSVIRFASPEVAERAGLGLQVVQQGPLRVTLEVPARLSWDARRHARLSVRAPGVVARVETDLGESVRAGETLLVADSPDLGAAKAALLQADARVRLGERTLEREQRLLQGELGTEGAVLEAETGLLEGRIALDAARQRLSSLGLDDAAIARVLDERDSSSQSAVSAPFDGVVVELSAVTGEPARPEQPLVAVVDPTRLWALLDLDPHDVRLVTLGDRVLLSAHGLEGETVAGRVDWISPHVDERTRTVTLRAELPNPGGLLRAGAFARASILVRDGEPAVLLPRDALQWDGCCNVAFVRRSATEYRPVKLRLGAATGDAYEVLDGLAGGETVVTQGSFLLKTELQKGSIGAGCCEVAHLDR